MFLILIAFLFHQTAPNQFYGAELECYAHYKSMRDYRLTEDTTHCPPWCLNLVATGMYTFIQGCDFFEILLFSNINIISLTSVNPLQLLWRCCIGVYGKLCNSEIPFNTWKIMKFCTGHGL